MAIKIDINGEIQETYTGKVLSTRESNFYDDSDFYAVVWDEATNRTKTVEYATTRAWTYNNSATVDATPEIIEKAENYTFNLMVKSIKENATLHSTEVSVNKLVKVMKGRKIPIGTIGRVVFVKANQYDRFNQRVCIESEGERLYTYANNLEIINPLDYMPTDEEIEEKARRMSGNFHTPFVPSNMVVM